MCVYIFNKYTLKKNKQRNQQKKKKKKKLHM